MKKLETMCRDCQTPGVFTSTACEECWRRKCVKKNVKLFMMGRYIVCSGDKYRLNTDDHKRLDEILDGSDLQGDEDPYKVPS